MRIWQKLLIAAAAVLAAFVFFKYFPHTCWSCSTLGVERGQVRVGDAVIHVEVADTPQELALGLSGRGGLGEDEGMLFVLKTAGIPAFWMKDMRFDIDIIWIDEEKRVVGIERDISRETYPEIFRPSRAVKYVLEIPAGASKRHKIDIGDELFFAF